MSSKQVFVCDECGIQKRETNHWWLVDGDKRLFGVQPWSEDYAHLEGFAHICGAGCLQRRLSKFTESVTGGHGAKAEEASGTGA